MNNISQNVCDVPEVGAEVTIESELPLENVCDVPKIDAEVTIESELQLEKGAEAIPQDFIVPQIGAEVIITEEEPFEIISNSKTFASKRFRLNTQSVVFKIKSVPEKVEPLTWVKNALDNIIKMCIRKTSVGDKIGFTLSGKSFLKGDARISFKNADQVKSDEIWSA